LTFSVNSAGYSLKAMDSASYDVDVYNLVGGTVISHAYSRKALLQVVEAPTILLSPVDQVVATSGL
jgi:hypothetical protein